MRNRNVVNLALQLALLAACSSGPAPASQPEPARPRGAEAPGAIGPGVQAPTAPGRPGQGPGAAGQRRRPPNPAQQDTLRRMQVDSILKSIAGREQEPAGKVFKNVRLLKTMPAGAFVRAMDTTYGRGLGWTCNNCHVVGQWDDDSRKNKRIARQMQELTELINTKQLPKVKELDAEYQKVTCVTCHRGSNEPRGSMPVPSAPTAGTTPPPPASPGGGPPPA
jgi:hypothetical protein